MKPLISIKDRALDVYNVPFCARTTADAVRGFTDEANSDPTRSAVAAHPDDYDMYIIGHFDEITAEITPLDRPELVVRAKDLIRPKGE